jgi:hypothetical protein
MEKELYVVYFESANYCGYGEHCLVWATDSEDAKEAATDYAEDHYYQQDEDQYKEEHEHDDEDFEGPWASFTKDPYPLASEEGEDICKWLLDPTQVSFYPIVNTKD